MGWVCEEVKRSPGGVGPSAVRIAATGAQGPLVVGYGVSVPWGATGGGSACTAPRGRTVTAWWCVCARLGCLCLASALSVLLVKR